MNKRYLEALFKSLNGNYKIW